MSDTVVQISTKEEVAYKLMTPIAKREQLPTKEFLLDLYAECLEATSGNRPVKKE